MAWYKLQRIMWAYVESEEIVKEFIEPAAVTLCCDSNISS